MKKHIYAKSHPRCGVNMFMHKECYGTTTVGERGQIVLPIEVRKKYKINAGDKFIVFGEERIGGIFLIKSEGLSKILSHINQQSTQMRDILENGTRRSSSKKSVSKK